mgnify:CR=1 FL=1
MTASCFRCNGFTVFTLWYGAYAVCCLFAATDSHFNGMLWCNSLMLGQGRGGFTLWYDYLSFCVMLPDGSVLWISV